MRMLLMIVMSGVIFHGFTNAMESSCKQQEEEQWIEALMQPQAQCLKCTHEHLFLCEKGSQKVTLVTTWENLGLTLNAYINHKSIISPGFVAESSSNDTLVKRFALFRKNAPQGESAEHHAAYIKALEYIAERGAPGNIAEFIKNEEQSVKKAESPSAKERKLTKRSSLYKLLSLVHHNPKETSKKEK